MDVNKVAPIQEPAPELTINLSAVIANYEMIASAAPRAKIAAVVKCDGYGLGAEKIADALLARTRCDTFFVAYAHEGAALRRLCSARARKANIFVFNGAEETDLDAFGAFELTPVLNSAKQASIWASAYPGVRAALHFDTGMNRSGAALSELAAIKSISGLHVSLLMSHLACSSDPSHPMNKRQRKSFADLCAHYPSAEKSLGASAGALMSDDYHFDLIRLGVALYGASPFDKDEPRIKPVATLKAPIIQLRNAAPGQSVGYGQTVEFERETTIATVAYGYGDGLHRAASNSAHGAIRGMRAPIIGRVSMDLTTLDVTDCQPIPQIGDMIEFFGPEMPIHENAAACGSVSYELLTSIGARARRRYVV